MRKLSKIFSILLLAICGFFIASTIDVEAAPIQVTAQYTGTTTNMIANENNAALIGLDPTIFNVITNKGSSSYEVGLNKDGTIRLYSSSGENKGTSMEIKVLEGYIIQAISYSIKASYSPDANIIVDNGEPVLYSGYTTGIQLDNIGASSVIIHNVNDATLQMHISQIEITYTSIPIKSLPGASIRTEGIQGLRFDAEVLDGTNIQEKGFYLLKGEATIADLMESLATMLYNGKTVFKQAVPGVAPDGRFSIVLTGIPIKGYLDDITVIPYVVKTDSEVVYSNPIVRSVGQVAILMDQVTQDPLPQGVQNVLNELENFYKGRYVGNNYEISEGVKDPVTNEYVNLDLYDIYNPTVTNITLPTPAAREGYTFNGWYNDSSHSGDPITTVATSSILNVATIYGKWTQITYNVTFNSNGGSAVDPQIVGHGNTAIEPAAPTKPGSLFVRWTLNGEAFDFTTPITSDIELVAEWTVATATAYFHETFTDISLPTGSYGSGTYTGVNGLVWTYASCRDVGSYAIDGKGVMLNKASESYIEITITSAGGYLYFEYRKAYTGASARELEVLVNGVQVGETTGKFGDSSGEDTTVYKHEVQITQTGVITIRIKNVGSTTTSRQAVIDNIKWSETSVLNPES
ncbi:MAG: InlB B-repeat-containing protein [Acholeplasmataceae bacterium]